jgi:hypothetical protein
MLLDKEAELATAVAFDLEAVRPGPGKPIKMYAHLDADGDLVITMGATNAAADPCMTVACVGITEFELPSTTLQFIKATFAGEVGVVMDVQTNK